MDKETAICNYLKKNHTGKANAAHSKELDMKISNARTGLMYSSVLPVVGGEIEITVRLKGADANA